MSLEMNIHARISLELPCQSHAPLSHFFLDLSDLFHPCAPFFTRLEITFVFSAALRSLLRGSGGQCPIYVPPTPLAFLFCP